MVDLLPLILKRPFTLKIGEIRIRCDGKYLHVTVPNDYERCPVIIANLPRGETAPTKENFDAARRAIGKGIKRRPKR